MAAWTALLGIELFGYNAFQGRLDFDAANRLHCAFWHWRLAVLIGEMGILDVLVVSMRERFQSERAVVLFTILCGIVMVLLLSSLYVSAVLIAELFAAYYDERGIDRSILSRTIEETTTITTPLIPWHSSYLYYTSLFQLNGMQFIPYTVFCWLNLIVSIVLTIFWKKIFLNNKHNGKKEELVC